MSSWIFNASIILHCSSLLIKGWINEKGHQFVYFDLCLLKLHAFTNNSQHTNNTTTTTTNNNNNNNNNNNLFHL